MSLPALVAWAFFALLFGVLGLVLWCTAVDLAKAASATAERLSEPDGRRDPRSGERPPAAALDRRDRRG